MKTRPVDRFHAKDYLQRAEECRYAMDRAFEDGKWNACMINAIHCAISAADAFCVYKKGLRSAGESHFEAITLFSSIDPNDPGIMQGVQHLSALISIKSQAEYGERLMNKNNAIQAVKHAERLFDFVKEKIK